MQTDNSAMLGAIAEQIGTPVYVYAAATIRERYRSLSRALGHMRHRIHYSVKANGNLGVLGVLRQLGAGVDIVSRGELARARRAGFDMDGVVYSGVGKSEAELRESLLCGVGLINIESAGELETISRIAASTGRRAVVGIRVNPDVMADTHPYTRTGTEGMKFGIPSDRLAETARRAAADANLSLESIGVHIGSQIGDPATFREAAVRLAQLVETVAAEGIDTLRRVDIGGGLGIRYSDETPLAPEDFAEALLPLVPTGLSLIVEPGRFLVGEAGVLLTRCVYMKRSGGRTFAIVDGGMNDFVRPSRYQAVHEITVISGGIEGMEGREVVEGTDLVDVVGPLCEAGDFLGLDRRLDGVCVGSLLAVHGAGAYGFSMSSNYNSRPRVAEVMMDDNGWAVTRSRETVDDLMLRERTLDEIDEADWNKLFSALDRVTA